MHVFVETNWVVDVVAVLIRAEELREDGVDRTCFCEMDSDLQPWDRRGAKPALAPLYDARRIWVYGDWERSEGPWDGWPAQGPPEET